jgi:hypothetical protein
MPASRPRTAHSTQRTAGEWAKRLTIGLCAVRSTLCARALSGFLLGLLFTPIAVYWGSLQPCDVILSLMVPPVACTFFLVLVNALIRRRWPRRGLCPADLVLFYAIVSVATAMAAEWGYYTTPLIYSYALFANPTNKFDTLVRPFVPSSFFIKDPAPIAEFKYGGHDFLYFLHHLGPWVAPFLGWTALVSLLAFAMLCINSLMREEWIEREKLSFPIIQLPLALTQGGPGFWRSRWMWSGFAVAAAVDLLNGLHVLYPSLPMLNVRVLADLSLALPEYPWNATGWTPIAIYPFIVGLSIFVPTDLLFSAVFFYFFRKAQQIIAASYGHSQGIFGGGWLVPSPPYFSEQSWGAFLGLCLTALYVARCYLRELWHNLWHGSWHDPGTTSRRLALLGLLASLGLLVWMGVAIGLAAPFLLLYLLLFLAFSVALTRMRAQLGPPTHEMAFMGPNQLIVDFHGTQGLSPPTIARLATVFHFLNRIHRTDPMPGELEAMKMGAQSGLGPRTLFVALLVAIPAGSLCGYVVRIADGYARGASAAGHDTAAVIADLVNNPRVPNHLAMAFVGLGMGLVFVLNLLRFRLPWFPFNPVGYALAMNFGVDYYWFGLLIALVVKISVQRYSGLKGYEKLRAVALGIILGEFSVEAIWAIMAMIGHMATYTISINDRPS